MLQLLDALAQAVFPVGDVESVDTLDAGLVEHGVVGTTGGSGILGRV